MSTFNCYNLRTDSGATFTNNVASFANKNNNATIPSGFGNWDGVVSACAGIQKAYLPANTTIKLTQNNNQLQEGLIVIGEGKGMNSTFAFDSSFSAGVTGTATPDVNDNIFQSIGHSNITFIGCKFTGNIKHLNAFVKLNSKGSTNSTVCRNINFFWCEFVDVWADGIKAGETVQGETHCIDGLTVSHCDFTNIGNPAQLYNMDDDATSTCHCVNGNQTTQTWTVEHCTMTNVSGDPIHANGYCQGSEKVSPVQRAGNWHFLNNTMENIYTGITVFGNGFVNHIKIIGNLIINPTRNTGFGFSITGNNIRTDGNTVITYEGRDAFEFRGSQCKFGKDTAIIYTGASPVTATARTVKGDGCNAILTCGYENSFATFWRYDYLLGVSAKCPDRLCGVHMVGLDSPLTQPTSWDNKSYMFGFRFDGMEGYNFSGPALYAEVVDAPISDVYLHSNCVLISPYAKENVVQQYGPRWTGNGFVVNLTGSANPNAGVAVVNINMQLPWNSAWNGTGMFSNITIYHQTNLWTLLNTLKYKSVNNLRIISN